MIRWWRSLICLFRRRCSLFSGDALTDWVEQEGRQSRMNREQLHRVQTGDALVDGLLGGFPKPRSRKDGEG